MYLVAGLGAALLPLATYGIGGLLGTLVGVVFVLFLPGYAAIALLFPAAGDITWVQRTTLSVGVSLAVAPLAGLLSNSMPGGVRIETVLAILAVVTVALAALAYRRRQALPFDSRLGLSLEIPRPRWRGLSTAERHLVVLLAVVLALGSAAVAYSASRPHAPPGFTEFYVLNETGVPANYPSDLLVGMETGVVLVVVNHESATVNYTIEIRLTTLAEAFNQTSGRNETVEVGNRTLGWINASIADGASARNPHRFTVDQPGEYALKFLLYREVPTPEPYRFLRLFLRVT